MSVDTDTTFVRDWFVEGHLNYDGDGKRVDHIWHPLYGPLTESSAKQLRNFMLDADEEKLLRMDKCLDEYDDFRAAHHPNPLPAAQQTRRRALVRADKTFSVRGATLFNGTPSEAHEPKVSKSIPNTKSSRKNLSKKTKIKIRINK